MNRNLNENPLDQSLRDVFQDYHLPPAEHPAVWENVARQLATPARPTVPGSGMLFRLGLPVAGLLAVLGSGWVLLSSAGSHPSTPVTVAALAPHATHSTVPARAVATNQPIIAQATPVAQVPAEDNPAPAPAAAPMPRRRLAPHPSPAAVLAAAAQDLAPSPTIPAPSTQLPASALIPVAINELSPLPPTLKAKNFAKNSWSIPVVVRKQPAAAMLASDTAELENNIAEARPRNGRNRGSEENEFRYRKASHRLAEPTGLRGWLKQVKNQGSELGRLASLLSGAAQFYSKS